MITAIRWQRFEGPPLLAARGALWLAHSGVDRMLGSGLKSPEGFARTHLARTHLGRIGKPH